MDRVEPDTGDAEPGQVVQAADQTADVADSVTVGIGEGVDVQAVDDGLLIPPVADSP
jgi:hypothetical protein